MFTFLGVGPPVLRFLTIPEADNGDQNIQGTGGLPAAGLGTKALIELKRIAAKEVFRRADADRLEMARHRRADVRQVREQVRVVSVDFSRVDDRLMGVP